MSAMVMDPKFVEKFNGRVGQAFLYLTDSCNLSCVQCLYKSELTFQLAQKEIPYPQAVALMENLHELGARKMTFMGGEPTLYEKLPDLIAEAKRIGYTYVRIDTNGMFKPTMLDNPNFRKLDEITFSLDGYTEEMNDAVRGKNSYKNCVANIKRAIEKGYKVHVTSCVHKDLVQSDEGRLGILRMVDFMKGLGVRTLNMHDLFKAGIPRDIWSGDVSTSLEDYMQAYTAVLDHKATEKDISIRMPQCFTVQEEFERNKEYYGYCSVKQYDRVLAFPNGMLRVCSLMIGSPYCVGFFDQNRMYWNDTPTNEILGHNMDTDTPCTNQHKGKHFGKYVPLCVSFKPKQDEPVWTEKLKWEDRRKDIQPPACKKGTGCNCG